MSFRISISATGASLSEVWSSYVGPAFGLFEWTWLRWLEIAAGKLAKSMEGYTASA